MPLSFTADALRVGFGRDSAQAKGIIPAFVHLLKDERLPDHAFTKKQRSALQKIAAHYHITDDPTRTLFALQSYYALVVKSLAACKLGGDATLEAVESGAHFTRFGVENMIAGTEQFGWYATAEFDWGALWAQIQQLDFAESPPDALKTLYHDLLPGKLRHALGEYYTPDWLAQHVLNRLGYDGQGRLLDPACGSGTFLAQALRRITAAGNDEPLAQLAGIDINPLACLAARANLLLATGRPQTALTLPIYCADSLLAPPQIGLFDVIAGNPPWVNWETLPPGYRQQTRPLWERYGLFPHGGMEAILGKGKKDLSLLMTYHAADCYLREGGKLGFIITHSILKSRGAGDGFRRFKIDDTPLRVLHIDDLSRVRPFPGVMTQSAIVVLQKGQPTRYPVRYALWRKNAEAKGTGLQEDAPLTDIKAMTTQAAFVAEPISTPQSPWLSGRPAALQAVRRLLGKSDYRAYSGTYTGGANAVYWLDVLEETPDGLRVRNIVDGAKRAVPQIEALIEPDCVYPFLRGKDVQRWQATPSAHILMVQDPQARRGYDETWLREIYPRTYAYLAQFEAILQRRAAYKRYFRDSAPFYTMFNVGTYSFAPVKVVWQGFGVREMRAVVIRQQGGKAIMSNQAMHPFIALDDEDEAHYLAALLNSPPFEYGVISHAQVGGKSFAQPGMLEILRLPRYDANDKIHQQLMQLSRSAHAGHSIINTLAQAAAQVWGLSASELDDLQTSLLEWR